MKDILELLNEKFQGEYSFLRLGQVDVSTTENTATITFLMPEEIYDHSFSPDDIDKIKGAVSEALDKRYNITFKFQKIILTEELFKNAMIEYMERYFPLIAANIDYARLRIFVGQNLLIRMAVQQNIYTYMPTVSFEQRIKEFAESKYVVKATFEYEILPDEIRTRAFEANQANRYGKTVQVSDIQVLFGKAIDLVRPAQHISTLRGDGQDVICCGKVKFLKHNTRPDSAKKEGKRFYRNYYTFSISDTTGFLNIFINLDGEIPLLKDGADVVCRGRVNLREDRSTYGMYAKAVALCTIPYDVIREQTKPLSPPEEYSLLIPHAYEDEEYSQLSLDGGAPKAEVPPVFLEPTVTVSIKTIETERAKVPYEVAMCHVEGNAIVSYVHTYLKGAFTEQTESAQYANSKGYSSPRFSSVIPDLVKFAEGKTLVAVDPKSTLAILNGAARPLRYYFANKSQIFSGKPAITEGENVQSALTEVLEMARDLLGKSGE